MKVMKNRVKKSLKYFWSDILSPKNWQRQLNTRQGFFTWIIVLLTFKTILAYGADFEWLHVQDPIQVLLMLINPVGFTIVLFSLTLFIKPKQLYYGALIFLDMLMSLLLYLNVIYFREFSDFMSVNTMLGYNTVNQGGKAAGAIAFGVHDILFWIDIIVLVVLLLLRKIRFDNHALPRFQPFKVLTIGFFILTANLLVADIDRPQLLRT